MRKKRRFELFSVYDHSGVERHLEKMAEKGWLLEKIGNALWTYREIEPQKLTFYVSCYPAASEYEPEQTEEQIEFQELCEHTGWKLAASAPRMQVFYNESENPAPIATEPKVEIEAIHKAVWKSFFPSQLLLMGVGVLNLFIQLLWVAGRPIDILTSGTRQFVLTAWTLVIVLGILEFVVYYVWRHRALKAAEEGEFLPTPSTGRLQIGLLLFVLGFYGFWLFNTVTKGDDVKKFTALIMIAYMTILITVVNGVKKFMQKKKVDAETNKIITLCVDFLLAFVMMGIIIAVVLQGSEKGWFEEKGLETYQFIGKTFVAYKDPLPLTVEDLTGETYTGYTYKMDVEKSLFATEYSAMQRERFDIMAESDLPELSYTITETKLPWVYEKCLDYYLSENQDEMADGEVVFINHYEEVDAAPWGADKAYQLYWSEGLINDYILCYGNKIVALDVYWDLTEEQMAIVGEKLK